MKQEKNIWVESVMNSHLGKKRLKPPKSLFDSITTHAKVKRISIRQLKIVGVAASLLLIINSVAIRNINISMSSESSEFVYENQLISDYNLYKYE